MTDSGRMFNSAVAQELSRLYTAGGWTLESLSDATGISGSSIRRYMDGTRDIPAPALAALAHALGARVSDVSARAEAALTDRADEVEYLSGMSPRELARAEREAAKRGNSRKHTAGSPRSQAS